MQYIAKLTAGGGEPSGTRRRCSGGAITMKHIHKCPGCNKYTLEKGCPLCGKETILPRPPKFSLEEKYGELRRKVKMEGWKGRGLY